MHTVINDFIHLSKTIIFQPFWGEKKSNWKKRFFIFLMFYF